MTMPTPFSEDLLSAYLDGELTPEERLAVERHLQNSPSLREQLDESAELSRSLRRLPRLSAPAEIHASVMSAIHLRSMSRPPRPAMAVESKPGTRRRLLQWQGWSAIAAICLLFVVGGWSLRPQEKMSITADHSSAPALADMAMHSPLPEVLSLGMEVATDDQSGELMEPVPLVIITEEQIREHLAGLNRPLFPGNTLSFTKSVGTTPIVVDLTVVDVMETVGQLQVLLRKQSSSGANNVVIESATDAPGGSQDSRLVAVYLEMDGTNMASLLNQVPALDAVVYVDGSSDEKATLEQQSLAGRSLPGRSQVEVEPANRRNLGATRGRDVTGPPATEPVNYNFNTLVVQNETQRIAPPGDSKGVGTLPKEGDVESRAVPPTGKFSEEASTHRQLTKSMQSPGVVSEPAPLPAPAAANSQEWAQAKKLRALLLLRQSDTPRVPKKQ